MKKRQLIYLPIEPLFERYTEQWYRNFQREFTGAGFSVVCLDGNALEDEVKVGTFLDINSTVSYKMTQLAKLSAMFNTGRVEQNSVIFVGDTEFWGLESIRLMAQMNKIKIRLASFLHAGSYTKEDAFAVAAPYQKFTEVGWVAACDYVFVGSRYHKRAFVNRRIKPLNLSLAEEKRLCSKIIVTGNPVFPMEYGLYAHSAREKVVVLTNRLDLEKRPLETLELFAKARKLDPQITFVVTSGRSSLRSNSLDIVKAFTKAAEEGLINLRVNLSKHDYHCELARARVMVSHSIEENFGYCIVEALLHDTLPFLRSGLSHTELVKRDKRFLFSSTVSLDQQAVRLVELVNSYHDLLPSIPKVDLSGMGNIIKILKKR